MSPTRCCANVLVVVDGVASKAVRLGPRAAVIGRKLAEQHFERPWNPEVDTSVTGQVKVLTGLMDLWRLPDAHDIISGPYRSRQATMVGSGQRDAGAERHPRRQEQRRSSRQRRTNGDAAITSTVDRPGAVMTTPRTRRTSLAWPLRRNAERSASASTLTLPACERSDRWICDRYMRRGRASSSAVAFMVWNDRLADASAGCPESV